jgi:2-polyprenyl-3-methyl-5-hydroxy-6-metoxy-1,4-benzoquinol methylase
VAINKKLLTRFLHDYPFQPATAVWRVTEIDHVISYSFPEGIGLDLGCGTGQFLCFAQKQGWTKVEGVEVIPQIANYTQQLTQSPIYAEDFLQVQFPDNFYSVITLWDVIEHLSDIPTVLNRVFQLLKPGGVVILWTPPML